MALNGVDLTVYQGEALGIIGRNGAGKSTLLKLLSRITAPTEGEIRSAAAASMLEVGTGFHPEMTGRENIYMNGAILGMTRTPRSTQSCRRSLNFPSAATLSTRRSSAIPAACTSSSPSPWPRISTDRDGHG